MEVECIDEWMNNMLPNGCFGNVGHHQCLAMGCFPADIHSFTESCLGEAALCPSGYHMENNNGSINFHCPDSEAEAHCHATFGPGFHLDPCFELGCELTSDSTYAEWCQSPEGVGVGFEEPVGPAVEGLCPEDCVLVTNGGSINFVCPDPETEDMCQATFGPDFTLHGCLHLGCFLSEDSTYMEWCEGGSCGHHEPVTDSDGLGTGGISVPTDGWQPLPLCPNGSVYKFNGQISEMQCTSRLEYDNCMKYIAHSAVDPAYGIQSAVHDCFNQFGML